MNAQQHLACQCLPSCPPSPSCHKGVWGNAPVDVEGLAAGGLPSTPRAIGSAANRRQRVSGACRHDSPVAAGVRMVQESDHRARRWRASERLGDGDGGPAYRCGTLTLTPTPTLGEAGGARGRGRVCSTWGHMARAASSSVSAHPGHNSETRARATAGDGVSTHG